MTHFGYKEKCKLDICSTSGWRTVLGQHFPEDNCWTVTKEVAGDRKTLTVGRTTIGINSMICQNINRPQSRKKKSLSKSQKRWESCLHQLGIPMEQPHVVLLSRAMELCWSTGSRVRKRKSTLKHSGVKGRYVCKLLSNDSERNIERKREKIIKQM
ncbi:uncharacterized protein ACIGJ3_004207 [Trichechus inunguis]